MEIISVKGNLINFPGILIIIHGNPVRSQGILIIIYGNFLGIDQIFPIELFDHRELVVGPNVTASVCLSPFFLCPYFNVHRCEFRRTKQFPGDLTGNLSHV